MQVFILLLALGLVRAEQQERTLPNVGVPFLGQGLFSSFLGGNKPNSNKTSSLLSPPFQESQINGLLSLFQNISQLFTQFQGQNRTNTPLGQQKIGNGPVPVFTTLPFNNLTTEEISWFWEGTPQQEQDDNDALKKKQSKFFGNFGGNTTFGDLNFLTIPQLLGAIGR